MRASIMVNNVHMIKAKAAMPTLDIIGASSYYSIGDLLWLKMALEYGARSPNYSGMAFIACLLVFVYFWANRTCKRKSRAPLSTLPLPSSSR